MANRQLQNLRSRAVAISKKGMAFNQSPILGMICSNLGSSVTATAATPLAAFAATDAGSWISAKGFVRLVQHWINVEQSFARYSADQRLAVLYGALTCFWNVDPSAYRTDDAIQDARGRMLNVIKHQIPPMSVIIKSINNWFSLINQPGMTTNRYHDLVLHTFPTVLLASGNDEWLTWQKNRCPINVEYQVPPESINKTELAVPKVDAALRSAWSELTEYEIISFFMSLAKSDSTSEHIAIASLFCMSSTIGKANFSETWVNSRTERLAEDYPGFPSSDLLSQEILAFYNQVFPKNHLNQSDLVGSLVYAYTVAESSSLKSVMWTLEQARSPNVSSLLALAESSLKHSALTYQILAHTFPEPQLKAVVELAIHIIHNPFCSLMTPPVPIARYADIAYVGIQLSFMENRGNKTKYGGRPDISATKSKSYLDAFVETIRSIEGEAGSDALSIEELFKSYNITLGKEGTKFKISRQPTEPSPSTEEGDEIFDRKEALAIILKKMTEADRAFAAIMSMVRVSASQQTLPTIADETSRPAVMTVAITDDLVTQAGLLGYTVPAHMKASTNILTEREVTYKVSSTLVISSQHLAAPVEPIIDGNA